MLPVTLIEAIGRALRTDDPEELGRPTSELLLAAIRDGRSSDAEALATYQDQEGKTLHDLMCDWVWGLLTEIARRDGEDAMYDMLRSSLSSSMMERTWKGFLRLTVEQRVQLTAEVMRSHRCGPELDGTVDVLDEEDRYVIRMDPCGSGGRMRRGDPEADTPSRLGPPYHYGVTAEAHEWSFGKEGVPYYCTHCAVNEILSMDWGGHPLWVTEYNPDASKPCAWAFYKSAEDIPVRYYERAGKTKPAPGEGRY